LLNREISVDYQIKQRVDYKMAITLELAPELENQIQQNSAKIGLTIDGFIMESIQTYLAGLKRQETNSTKRFPKEESHLLMKINQSLSQVEWSRYHALIAKRQDETLQPAEQAELIQLSDEIEEKNAKRIQHVAELARLRRLTLSTMMSELGLRPFQEIDYANVFS